MMGVNDRCREGKTGREGGPAQQMTHKVTTTMMMLVGQLKLAVLYRESFAGVFGNWNGWG